MGVATSRKRCASHYSDSVESLVGRSMQETRPGPPFALHPLAKGARVAFAKGKPVVTDGPFIESKEVLGGYWLVEAPSKEEVVKWAQRCPANEGDTIEIRQIFGPEDFAK